MFRQVIAGYLAYTPKRSTGTSERSPCFLIGHYLMMSDPSKHFRLPQSRLTGMEQQRKEPPDLMISEKSISITW